MTTTTSCYRTEAKAWLSWLGVILVIIIVRSALNDTVHFDIAPLLIGGLSAMWLLPVFRKRFSTKGDKR